MTEIEFSSGDFKYKYISSRTCSVGNNSNIYANGAVKGSSFSGTAVIPSKVFDSQRGRFLIVTTLAKFCFRSCANLNAVSLPNSLITIMQDSFFDTNIKSIIIPESVKTIEHAAFSGMKKLEEIIFRSGKLKTIFSAAFAHTYKLTRVVIPPTVSSINANIFAYTDSNSNIDFIYCGSHPLENSEMLKGGKNVRAFVTKNYPSEAKLGDLTPTKLSDDNTTCNPYLFPYVPLQITKQNCRTNNMALISLLCFISS